MSEVKVEKPPHEPIQFVASYKFADNSGQRTGIFQELVEGEFVFIYFDEGGVQVMALTKNETRYIDEIDYSLEAAATTLMQAGVRGAWTDDAENRIMVILGFPDGSSLFVKSEETEDEG